MDAVLTEQCTEQNRPVIIGELREALRELPYVDEAILEDEDEKYSMWIDYGGEYVPATNLKTTEKLPSGVYKIIWKNDDYRVVPIKLNTDELYRFSEDFTDTILKESDKFWKRADIYKKYKFTHKRGILLAGAPGTGKTAVINLLIEQLIKQGGIVFFINSIKEFNMYTDIIKTAVREIEPDRPIVTIIEDIDQIISNMNGNDSEILDLLDGKYSIEHHLVILTSNNTSELSEALLRPSRIDLMYEIPAPDARIRKEFFENKGIDSKHIKEYVTSTEGMSFAEMKEVFTGTVVLGKPLAEVINQIKNPLETKDYLTKSKKKIGI